MERKVSEDEDDMSYAAFELYGEPTIEDTEEKHKDKALPNGQQSYCIPDGFAARMARRQYLQEKGYEIGLV